MQLRTVGEGAQSLEDVAGQVVGFLREHFVDKNTGTSALPLVRCYVTQRLDQLEPDLRDYAVAAAGSSVRFAGDLQCLALLATAGEEDAWNHRSRSVGHKALPLPSVGAINRMPMVAQLIEQLGLDPRHVVTPDPALFRDLDERSYNVFYVADAFENPAIPAQADFVIPYGVRSVVGFGAVMPDGMLLAVVMFSRVPIPPSAVDGFAATALSVKLAALPHVGRQIFSDGPPSADTPLDNAIDRARIESRATALDQLLEVRYAMVNAEASRLEHLLARAEDRAAELATSRAALALSEARKTAIVEGALDCVIGMNASGRITDFNQAAERTFGHDRNDVIGQMLSDVIVPEGMRERHRLGLAHLRQTGEGPILGRRIEVNALHADGHEFPVELTVTPIEDTDPPQFTGYIRDLSVQRRAAADLAASHERLAHIARTLQASLLPPELPTVAGLEIGAAFHAMGDGYEVGGDFYDAFELKEGRWAFTLGDVCGKGSEAAAITALARYTIRASAMRSRNATTVLQTVNEAVHRNDPSRYCTAAYVAMRPGSGQLTLVLGGHPQPLVLRADGTVEAVGSYGALLGTFPSWKGSATKVDFGPGDLLLLYSDGVTEARSGDEFYGEDRLTATLASARGLDAASVVQLIEGSVLDFAGGITDDVTMLAIRAVG